ncbi:GAF domain-containing protein [Actinopolymorpha rutila]|uniref:GAF domain-containing protein n=2 Tax=Actinopolymorpha rutila TaxID=446787 RepID=A0A852ZJG9_9ACTN|nr:GAF domain-containing protein [Actinopolymorpha rutila]
MHDMTDRLATGLVEITGGLTDERGDPEVLFQVTDACVQVLGATATGVLMVDPHGVVRVVTASDEGAEFVELLQAQTDQGPCVDCVRTGEIVVATDLSHETRWPRFATAAMAAGYHAVDALPMRLDGRAVGGLNLLYAEPGESPRWRRDLAQSLADLAVLGLAQEPGARRTERLFERTLAAVNDRAKLAQAVGMVAGGLGIDVDHAWTLVRHHARSRQIALRVVAQALTSGSLRPSDLDHPVGLD